ncbi:SIS domain-containing protein [Virgibacillus halophilus]|uniref:SIS domain-containing protein n=1 Tax=Tigheibacillus halophilus TaxID=361280 RepID=A0ABU5C3G9_9BACI|nr:SIS domain-containing protein [Virgibacillus halophilus]
MTEKLFGEKDALQGFIASIIAKHGRVKVIFTGAGTSAFAGDTLVPELRKLGNPKLDYEAIATTDIVSNPTEYLLAGVPTVLVSFARSGNSPESVAAVKLGQQIVKDFYQVVITCNKDGQLAKNTVNDANSLTILTPEKAHDQGFAMTSSYTSMMIAARFLFSSTPFTGKTAARVIANAELLREKISTTVDQVLDFDFNRIIYLGSGLLGQLSHEAALKMLELTAGNVVAVNESSLGFRHGPKSILHDQSVVVLMMSQDPYTRKYDLDILRELSGETSKVVALTEKATPEVEELADWTIAVNDGQDELETDFQLALLYVMFAQVLALKKSLQLGITPDNPSPEGKVNRVVQGVTIYELD